MKTLLMSVERQKAEFVDAPWDFEELYKLINCQTIELAYRFLDGTEFMFALDEEGLFVQNQKIIVLIGILIKGAASIEKGGVHFNHIFTGIA